jgi:hypothetical protein
MVLQGFECSTEYSWEPQLGKGQNTKEGGRMGRDVVTASGSFKWHHLYRVRGHTLKR